MEGEGVIRQQTNDNSIHRGSRIQLPTVTVLTDGTGNLAIQCFDVYSVPTHLDI